MNKNIKKNTENCLKDLHARESMRLSMYRHFNTGDQRIQNIRERKANHYAFLSDLLRKRDLKPVWYAWIFYYFGHIFGWFIAVLPLKLAKRIESTMEFWILMRYEKYFKQLKLDFNLRTMVEAVQLKKLNHQEPAKDVLDMLENFISDEKGLINYSE